MPRLSTWRNFVRAPWPLLFCVAGMGVFLVAAKGGDQSGIAALCRSADGLSPAAAWPGLMEARLTFASPGALLADWALMLVAMMPPLLAMPLMHVWHSSRPRLRAIISADFVLAYGIVWLLIGPILAGLAMLLQIIAPSAASSIALLLALMWSASPWQRAALNRSHRLTRVSLFGSAAHLDSLAFGARHGAWCVASCWAWMLLPMASGQYHLPVMVLVGAIMLVERIAMPRQPCWRVPVALNVLQGLVVVPSLPGRDKP